MSLPGVTQGGLDQGGQRNFIKVRIALTGHHPSTLSFRKHSIPPASEFPQIPEKPCQPSCAI
eukprot:6533516-Pyramimonas_sp.AAC.1